MEYDKTISGYYTSDASAKILALPFQPDGIELYVQGNAAGNNWGSSANPGVVKWSKWFKGMAADTALAVFNTNGAATDQATFVAADGFSLYASDPTALGPIKTGTIVSQASPAVVTINSHGYQTGDTVLIYGTTGMLQIAGIPYVVTRTGANTFTIPVNSSAFAAAATAVKAKKVLYPSVFQPDLDYITAITVGATTTVTFSRNHSFAVGGQVRFLIPSQWGSTELDGVKGYITSTPSLNSIVVDYDSSAATAFAYPTSAVAAVGMSFPQVLPVGELAGTFDSAFADYGTQGVIIGSAVVGASGALVLWKAFQSVKVYTS